MSRREKILYGLACIGAVTVVAFFVWVVADTLRWYGMNEYPSHDMNISDKVSRLTQVATTTGATISVIKKEQQIQAPGTTTVTKDVVHDNEKKPSDVATQSTEPAEVPTASPVRNVAVGVAMGETLSVLDAEELRRQMDDLAELGVGWLRAELAWNTIQYEGREVYHWEAFDRIVTEAHARGIRLLVVVMGTPRWARAPECSDYTMCPPRDMEEYATFVAQAVTRYAPLGVHTWEVWNEPNIAKFWASGADAEAYAEMLKAAYVAIKAKDASAFVILGGLAPSSTGNGRVAPRNFLEELYVQYGVQGYFDAIGWHPYTYPVLPTDVNNANAWSQMADVEWSVRSIMADHGDASKQVWLTEYGAPTGGPGSMAESNKVHLWSHPDHVSEAYQATLMNTAFATARTYAWAGPLFWYSYKDIGTDASDVENFFGILRADGSRKPAYEALRELVRP